MGRFTALGFIALVVSCGSSPAPQVCCVLPAQSPCEEVPPPCEPLSPSPETPATQEDDARPTPNGDGPIKVIVRKTQTQDQLRAANFQAYPVSGGVFYIQENPDVLIQPPPILVKPPLLKPIQPNPINVQPPQQPPITPPPICVRPAPLPPITPPPICVRPKPLPPIRPPAIIVKPPTPQPVQPAPISIRQPELPPITPAPIVVRPPTPPNIQLPSICFRTSLLSQNGSDSKGSNSGVGNGDGSEMSGMGGMSDMGGISGMGGMSDMGGISGMGGMSLYPVNAGIPCNPCASLNH